MQLAGSESQFIVKDGTLAGVALGYSFCDEHDMGYDPILDGLGVGVNPGLTGNDKLLVTSGHESVRVHKFGDKVALSFLPDYEDQEAYQVVRSYADSSDTTQNSLMAWWDQGGFVVMSKGRGGEFLLKMADGLKENGVCFGLADGSAFHQQLYPVFVMKDYARDLWQNRLN